MAWQLIYTSAPRLLEAGRTGFGTVARHRAVGALVAAAVERYSQFARLPGLGARRVIHSHRIITVGSAQYHVFSCIRDAGSDYTGRTNHLAHHLIAETREVKALAGTGITPADVLLQMPWRHTWTEPPRFLDPSEEVALSGLRSRAMGSAWERVTGTAELARLPCGRTHQRCFLVLPPEVEPLELFRESLAHAGGQTWQTTLTTSLEPTDDSADFRWIGLPASSPLKAGADISARPMLDLTQPNTLPAPEPVPDLPAPAAARAGRDPRASSRLANVEGAAAPSSRVTVELAPMDAAAMEPLGRASAKPARGPAAFMVAMAGIIVLGGGSATWFWLRHDQAQRSAAEATAQARRVDDLWARHNLQLRITANWLKGKADAALVTAHEKALQALEEARREPQRTISLHRPEETQDEFTAMLNAFNQWREVLQSDSLGAGWDGKGPVDMRVDARAGLERLAQNWKHFAKNFTPAPADPSTLREDLRRRALGRLEQSQPEGTAQEWHELLSVLSEKGAAPGWVNSWVTLGRMPAAPAPLTAKDQGLLASFAGEKEAPAWFLALVKARQAVAEEVDATTPKPATATPAPAAPPPAPVPVAAEAPEAAHPVYRVFGTKDLPLGRALQQLPELPTAPDMRLQVGGGGFEERNLVPWRALGAPGVYRKSLQDTVTMEFKQGRLVHIPSESESWRILGRDAKGVDVLFEINLVALERQPTAVLRLQPALKFEVSQTEKHTVLSPAALAWFQRLIFTGTPPLLRLDRLDGTSAAERYNVKLEAEALRVEADAVDRPPAATAGQVKQLHLQIDELRKGIANDEQRKKELLASNHTQKEKDDGERRLSAGIADKQIKIAEIEENMKSLTAPTPAPGPARRLPTGRYQLAAVYYSTQGEERSVPLCELSLIASTSPAPVSPKPLPPKKP